MKKLISLLVSGVLAVSLVACGGTSEPEANAGTTDPAAETVTLTVGATVVPHAEILNFVKEDLKAEGIDLVVKEFSDYTLVNPALTSGELDANYFQHQPYLDSYLADSGENLVMAGNVHVEPIRVYSNSLTSIEELADGAKVAIPNDATNEGRSLVLLEKLGLIKLDPAVGVLGTPKDITENPKNLEFVELDAYLLPRSLDDADIAVIQTNVAIEAGLEIEKSIAVEDAESPYANGVTVRAGDENREEIQKLLTALQSEKVKTFIEENYNGAVVPAFN